MLVYIYRSEKSIVTFELLAKERLLLALLLFTYHCRGETTPLIGPFMCKVSAKA